MLMDENLHHIDDLFRKGLSDGEDTPPQRVWEHIEDALDRVAKPAAPAAFRWLKPVSAVASLVLVGTAVYMLRSVSPVQQSGGDSALQVPEVRDSVSVSAPMMEEKAHVAPGTGKVSAHSAESIDREPVQSTAGPIAADNEIPNKPPVV